MSESSPCLSRVRVQKDQPNDVRVHVIEEGRTDVLLGRACSATPFLCFAKWSEMPEPVIHVHPAGAPGLPCTILAPVSHLLPFGNVRLG